MKTYVSSCVSRALLLEIREVKRRREEDLQLQMDPAGRGHFSVLEVLGLFSFDNIRATISLHFYNEPQLNE